MASARVAVARGFACFALSKTIYYRSITRSAIPPDTQIKILLNQRRRVAAFRYSQLGSPKTLFREDIFMGSSSASAFH
jgi:hypothetical protein